MIEVIPRVMRNSQLQGRCYNSSYLLIKCGRSHNTDESLVPIVIPLNHIHFYVYLSAEILLQFHRNVNSCLQRVHIDMRSGIQICWAAVQNLSYVHLTTSLPYYSFSDINYSFSDITFFFPILLKGKIHSFFNGYLLVNIHT